MKHNYEFTVKSEVEMSSITKNIAKAIDKNTTILLKGNLGSGKTFIAKNIISSLVGIEKNEIDSPTFTILNEYTNPDYTIHHYDLYRIKNINELKEIGIFDNINQLIHIIEWPEIVEDYLIKFAKSLVIIDISHINDIRIIKIDSNIMPI